MKSILHELHYGNIAPSERPATRSPEQNKALQAMCDNEEKLLSHLNAEEKAWFEAYTNAHDDLNLATEADSFIDGFCLGMQIAIEVMAKQF